jgi:16S rRNA processing protein RimM
VGDAGERPSPEHLVVGHVAKPHGTKGELFVWPLTDRPDEVLAAGSTVLVGGADGELGDEPGEVRIEASRPFKRGVLVRLAGCEGRAAVAALAGRYLFKPITALGALEEGEVFYHQLIGAEVVTVDGEVVGRVREVFETQPAHLLQVRGGAKEHLIPFAQRIVKSVDVEAGRIVIRPPPGLLEL